MERRMRSHFQYLETEFHGEDESRTDCEVSSLQNKQEAMTLNGYRKKQQELKETGV